MIRKLLLIGIILILLSSLVISCREVSDYGVKEVDDPEEGLLIGSWRLIMRCNFSWGDSCRTAEEMGYEIFYIFYEDGMFRMKIDDTTQMVSHYRVVVKEDIRFNHPARIIEIEGGIDQAYDFLGKDTLSLEDVAFDGGGSLFVRH
jgi:hypothetical protein